MTWKDNEVKTSESLAGSSARQGCSEGESDIAAAVEILPPEQALTSERSLIKAIEQTLQKLARDGLIVDTGRRRWSKRTRSYQIVWAKAPGAKFAPLTTREQNRPMTMFINRLIALLPNPWEETYQLRWMAYRGINPLPLWTVKWFYDLLDRVHGWRR